MTTAPAASDGATTRPRRRLPLLTEVVIAVVAVALVQAFLVKPFGVPSRSMENTLHVGDRILVNRLDTSVARGDVVVFGHGETWQDRSLPAPSNPLVRALRWMGDLTGIGPSSTAYTVKRVIGLPGERVACCSEDGKVTVDAEVLDEPYVFEDLPFTDDTQDCSSTPRSTRCFPEITVPEDMLLVLGDHRSQSADSVIGCRGASDGPECARLVPVSRVVGPVVLRFWPVAGVGGLPHQP
ncbi:signal peptidase I [Oryzobacter sp. R7]|uniref:signal peptidase I n=1 Tax=Oryzobacter faecalis TaxID=3388656 RepID=UPI00398CF23A